VFEVDSYGDDYYGVGRPPVHPADRFWPKVRVGGPDECWHWTASTDVDGYGKFKLKVLGKWRNVKSSRMAWVLTRGDVPIGKQVILTCYNRKCCNPDHLELMTREQSRETHHRPLEGEDNPKAKLTAADVIDIRQRLEGGERQAHIATEYEVTIANIGRIARRLSWRSVAPQSSREGDSSERRLLKQRNSETEKEYSHE